MSKFKKILKIFTGGDEPKGPDPAEIARQQAEAAERARAQAKAEADAREAKRAAEAAQKEKERKAAEEKAEKERKEKEAKKKAEVEGKAKQEAAKRKGRRASILTSPGKGGVSSDPLLSRPGAGSDEKAKLLGG